MAAQLGRETCTWPPAYPRAVLSRSHIGLGDLVRRLKIEAAYSL
jgi:hypothetical protein